MTISLSELDVLASSLANEQNAISSEHDLEDFKRRWLSKEGLLKTLFSKLREVDPTEKPQVAASLNKLKASAELFVDNKSTQLKKKSQASNIESEFFDLSLPAMFEGLGGIHPVTFTERTITNVLRPFGFRNVFGPEIESEYYCFDALNIPKHHPARDMQDTFYTETGHVLRTHTTSVQARELEKGILPVKIASFGKAYRNETEDASHQAMFHQFELVWLDKGLTIAHLMGLITHIVKSLYGKKRKVKFVPKYYPYTEPSIGPQVDCGFCHGAGCPACGGAGWATIGGAGMIHREVLKHFKYNPSEVSGFAFGLGSSRLASQFSGIPTLKMLYENDLRVLKNIR